MVHMRCCCHTSSRSTYHTQRGMAQLLLPYPAPACAVGRQRPAGLPGSGCTVAVLVFVLVTTARPHQLSTTWICTCTPCCYWHMDPIARGPVRPVLVLMCLCSSGEVPGHGESGTKKPPTGGSYRFCRNIPYFACCYNATDISFIALSTAHLAFPGVV
jgi:hypothetical protein